MTVADLRTVRACLDPPSRELLNRCAVALDAAGVFDVLLDLAPQILQELQPVSARGDDTIYALGPITECLLVEYLAIAGYDAFTEDDKRTAMRKTTRLAGLRIGDTCDDDC